MNSVLNPEEFDPFAESEIGKLRLSQNYTELVDVKPVLTRIPCRKPHRQEFIRVLAGNDNRFPTQCFHDLDSQEKYLVSPQIQDMLGNDAVPTLLVVCVTRTSAVPFLWGLTLPRADGRTCDWHRSALEAAKIAETHWVKVVSDSTAGCYVPTVAVGNLSEPDWSNVPPIAELLRLSFRDRIIDSADHPVLKRLRGEI